MPEIMPAVEQGPRLDSVSLDAADASLLSEWQSFRNSLSMGSPSLDPEWLRGYFDGQTDNIRIFSLRQADSLSGLASFIRRDWPLKWHLGELTVATFRLSRLRLLGGELAFPPDETAYDMLFHQLAATANVDAVHLEEVPVDSFLWRYLQTSPVIQKSFLYYQPEPPSPHPILRIEGTFEQYMSKFSSKHRKNVNREVKKLREGALGEMRFVRFERPDETDAFLDQAVELSRKTYQWRLHNRGLSATDKLRRRLAFAARHGWMRSYMLYCGGRPCAFMVGLQHDGRFLLLETGYDPDLARYSVGTVLQFLTVEDLFNYRRPELFDLQDYGQYKEVLSTESYLQGKVLLFRRSLYAHLLTTGHYCCQMTTKTAARCLDRLQWKSKLKKQIRSWSGSR